MELTESERAFESYCSKKHLEFFRVPTDERKSPDYLLKVGDLEIVIEVKQIEPNREEREALGKLETEGFSASSTVPGQRVRKKITDSAPQLKRHAEKGRQTILLLYSTDIFQSHIEPYHIRVGMYGFHTIYYAIPSDRSKRPKVIGESLGKGKKMTDSQNTSISALAIMLRTNYGLDVTLYHNIHSRFPIEPSSVRNVFSKQRTLGEVTPGRAPDWVEI